MLPLTNCNTISFITPLGVGIFSFFITFLLARKYQAKQTGILKALTLMVMFLSLAVISDPINWFIGQFQDINPGLAIFSSLATSFPFAFSAIAMIFLLSFTSKVFLKGAAKGVIWTLFIVEIAVAVLVPSMTFARYYLGADTTDANLAILLVHAGVWVTINVTLAVNAFRVRARIDKKTDFVGHKGMGFIGYSGVLLIITLLMFIMQEIQGNIPEFSQALLDIGFKEGGCTYFIAIGWIFAGISAATLYIGYLMPDWIKKLWE